MPDLSRRTIERINQITESIEISNRNDTSYGSLVRSVKRQLQYRVWERFSEFDNDPNLLLGSITFLVTNSASDPYLTDRTVITARADVYGVQPERIVQRNREEDFYFCTDNISRPLIRRNQSRIISEIDPDDVQESEPVPESEYPKVNDDAGKECKIESNFVGVSATNCLPWDEEARDDDE